MTSDGKLYAPERVNQIVRERYEISKRINTSYADTGKISVKERMLLLQFIKEDIEHDNEVMQEARNKANMKR